MPATLNHMSTVGQSQFRRAELQRRTEFLRPSFVSTSGDDLFAVFCVALILTTFLLFLMR